MVASPKVLMLALDSATPALLRQWTADGTMPNVARLRTEGLEVPVAGPEGLEVGATWSTFMSGRWPGHHGISWVDRILPGTYREQRMHGDDFSRVRPFWLDLNAAGRRLAIMDVPFAPLAEKLNGFQVVEWGAHEGLFGFQTTPASLKRTIKRNWGVYPWPLECETGRLNAPGYRKFADTLIEGIRLRGALTSELLADGGWDLSMQVFTELHCAGHLLWHYHDPRHPASNPDDIARYGDLLREVYVAADTAIGEILSATDADTTVLTGCLHTMEHTCGTSLLLPQMLEGIGAMRRASLVVPDGNGAPMRRGVTGWLKAAYHRIPAAIRVPFYEWRQDQINRRLLRRGEPIDIDPTGTRAFQMGFGAGSSFSGIRLNMIGREPEGLLAPGDEVDRYCEQLERDLHTFTDPDTGQPLVGRVLRTADLYPGERVDDLPDLLVEWQYDPPRGTLTVGSGAGGIWRGYSERTGLIEHANGSGRTGAHRLPGLLFVRGPGIRPGVLDRVVPTVDFAPTISRMLGCDLSGGDGRPISELLPNA